MRHPILSQHFANYPSDDIFRRSTNTTLHWFSEGDDEWVLHEYDPKLVLSIRGRVMTWELHCGMLGSLSTKQLSFNEAPTYSLLLAPSDHTERAKEYWKLFDFLEEIQARPPIHGPYASFVYRTMRRAHIQLSCPVFNAEGRWRSLWVYSPEKDEVEPQFVQRYLRSRDVNISFTVKLKKDHVGTRVLYGEMSYILALEEL